MKLVKEIEHSIYGPEYYQNILHQPFSASVKYYLKFSLIIALIATAALSFALVPALYYFINTFGQDIASVYPEKLSITIEDGRATTTTPGQTAIPLPAVVSKNIAAYGLATSTRSLLVVDTGTSFKPDDLERLKTVALLDGDELLYKDPENRIVIQSLSQMPNMVINRSEVVGFVANVRPLIKILAPLLVLIMFLLFVFVLALNFLYLLFAALLIMLMARLEGVRVGYRKAYQLGLHALTAAVLFEYIGFVFLPQRALLFVPTLILLLVIFLNLKPAQRDKGSI